MSTYGIAKLVMEDGPATTGYLYSETFDCYTKCGDGANAEAYFNATPEQITEVVERAFPEGHEFRRKVVVFEATIDGKKAAIWKLPKDEYLLRHAEHSTAFNPDSYVDAQPNSYMVDKFFDGLEPLSLRGHHFAQILYLDVNNPLLRRRDEDVGVIKCPRPEAALAREPYSEPTAKIADREKLRPYPTGLLKHGVPRRHGIEVCPNKPGIAEFLDALGVEEIIV